MPIFFNKALTLGIIFSVASARFEDKIEEKFKYSFSTFFIFSFKKDTSVFSLIEKIFDCKLLSNSSISFGLIRYLAQKPYTLSTYFFILSKSKSCKSSLSPIFLKECKTSSKLISDSFKISIRLFASELNSEIFMTSSITSFSLFKIESFDSLRSFNAL